jgi:hypothetical protein
MKKIISKKSLLKKIKEKPENKRRNVTYSLPSHLVDSFKKECIKSDVSMNEIIQAFLEEYIKS